MSTAQDLTPQINIPGRPRLSNGLRLAILPGPSHQGPSHQGRCGKDTGYTDPAGGATRVLCRRTRGRSCQNASPACLPPGRAAAAARRRPASSAHPAALDPAHVTINTRRNRQKRCTRRTTDRDAKPPSMFAVLAGPHLSSITRGGNNTARERQAPCAQQLFAAARSALRRLLCRIHAMGIIWTRPMIRTRTTAFCLNSGPRSNPDSPGVTGSALSLVSRRHG